MSILIVLDPQLILISNILIEQINYNYNDGSLSELVTAYAIL